MGNKSNKNNLDFIERELMKRISCFITLLGMYISQKKLNLYIKRIKTVILTAEAVIILFLPNFQTKK